MACFAVAISSAELARAQQAAPPPPIEVQSAPPEAVAAGTPTPDSPSIRRLGAQIRSFAFGDGQSVWVEDAEGGAVNVIDGTDAAYPLIQSEVAGEGTYAFHLAHPAAQPNWFELNVDIDVGPLTKLFFLSKLGYATSDEKARVEVSTNGGSTWIPMYSQPGSGGAGEGAFSLREVDLGTEYNGQQVRIRFYYDFAGGSYYPQTDVDVGWLIDDVQVGEQYEKISWSVGDPTASEVRYVQLINRSRADASAEAERLRDIADSDILGAYVFFGIVPANIVVQYAWHVNNAWMDETAQPLAIHAQLTQAARLHSQDMFNNNFQGHVSSPNPVAPILPLDQLANRVGRVGYTGWVRLGENVFAYSENTDYGHAAFEVDWGTTSDPSADGYNPAFVGQGMQNPPGHRLSLHDGEMNEIGVGVINGSNGGVGPQIVTQDLGERPGVAYICGVVYDDLDSDGLLTVVSDANHEGRGGVRVDVNGSSYYCVTPPSGAYAVPVTADGTYTVTFSGPGILDHSTTVTIAGMQNVALDYDPTDSGYAAFAAAYGLVGGVDDDDDGDLVSNGVEYTVAGMNPALPDAHRFVTTTFPAEGQMQMTVLKRGGVSDLALQALVSADLIRWVAPGVLPGTDVVSEDAAHVTISVVTSLRSVFAGFVAQ